LNALRQLSLLEEGRFLQFARERGVPVIGIGTGDPGEFHRRGWLTADDKLRNGCLRFHPFRILPLLKILDHCQLRVARSALITPDARRILDLCVTDLERRQDQLATLAEQYNRIADLAILLEPIYWPKIVSLSVAVHAEWSSRYRQKVVRHIRLLDPAPWKAAHKQLRNDAAELDNNPELYLLLRVAPWREREAVRGGIGGALWIRHIAEVIRRAFEEAQVTQWEEEDQAHFLTNPNVRHRKFGSDRPLKDPTLTKPYLAYHFGLHTGSVVRWYVEGDTEYGAVSALLERPARFGVEVVNLGGKLVSLAQSLAEDLALRRFSLISFDTDERSNLKTMRAHAGRDRIVGAVAAHAPDFEFANFTIDELVEIAARFDDAQGFKGEHVRKASWEGIKKGRDFEARYRKVSERKRDIKGEHWGKALAEYIREHPRRPDGKERPILQLLRAAMLSWNSNYDRHKQDFRIDPNTFQSVPRATTGDRPSRVPV